MKGKACALVLILLLSLVPAKFASAGDTAWVKVIPGVEIYDVKVTEDGDIIAVGMVYNDVWVGRFDRYGNVKWQKRYGGGWRDHAWAVAVAENGDIIVAGLTYSFSTGLDDIWVLRLDSQGNIKWQRSYGGGSWDWGTTLAIAPNGDIIVAGNTLSFGAGDWDVWILRLDENGNVKWQKTFGGGGKEGAYTLALTPNGDIIVAGWTYSFSTGLDDIWVLRLDSQGNIKWQKSYGGISSDGYWNVNIVMAPNGDIVLAGKTTSFGSGDYDVWILRLDENGNVKWQKTFGGRGDEEACSVAIANNGDIIVAGYTTSFGAGSRDVWVLRLDENGNVKWQKAYGWSDEDWAFAVALAPNGDIIVAGYTYSFGDGGGLLMRLPPDCLNTVFSSDTNAVVMNTDAVVTDTNAVVTDTSATMMDTSAQPVEYSANPDTLFSLTLGSTSVEPAVVKVGDPVTVNATATVVETTVSTFNFSVSDGRSFLTGAVQVSPGVYSGTTAITFDEPGDYTVTAHAIDEYGNVVWKDAGTVKVVNVLPNFTAIPTVARVRDVIIFNASPTVPQNTEVASYEWDFDDGTTGNGEVVTHSFAEPRDYNVTLKVRDIYGFEYNTSKTVKIVNVTPAFTVSANVADVGEELIFDASPTEPQNTEVVEYCWDFGDGSSASGFAVTHTYSEPGNYTVILTVRDAYGFEYSTNKTITVKRLAVTFGWDVPVPLAGQKVIFTPNIDVENTEIASITWDFGDGTIIQANAVKPVSHSFAEPGDYVIRLVVEDVYGDKYVREKSIKVVKLVANFVYESPVYMGYSTVFDASSSIAENTEITCYIWFVDGMKVGKGRVLTWTFRDLGVYRVTLKVVDIYGHEAEVTLPVVVKMHPFEAYTTLARTWTFQYFMLHSKFDELYNNAVEANVSEDVLEKAVELHGKAEKLITEAWKVDSVEDIERILIASGHHIPKIWLIFKAYRYEKEAVKTLEEALES